MSPEMEARYAKAKETRARNKALKSSETEPPTSVKSEITDDRPLFLEGLKLGIRNLDIRSPNELQRAIPFAKEFVNIVKANS